MLACEWCDTPYSWRWADHNPAVELHNADSDEILGQLDAMGVDMVVVTGGEPLLQQRELKPLVDALRAERGWRVEIETAGTIAPALNVDQWNVSPKLANSGNPQNRRYKPDVLGAFEATGKAIFKFVVTDPCELAEVEHIVDECGLRNVWIMPEGTDADTVVRGMQSLSDSVIDRGWNLTTRLHILLWGDERGK